MVLTLSCKTPTKKIKVNSEDKMEFRITSPSFNQGDLIPKKFTCDGENFSPEINWVNSPSNTKSFVLICDDPDAPMGTWVHWVVYNLPSGINSLPENLPNVKHLSNGAEQGINDFGKYGYGGPCPPSGTHRYFFKLYALDTELNLNDEVRKKDVVKSMQGHIIAKAELMAKYKR